MGKGKTNSIPRTSYQGSSKECFLCLRPCENQCPHCGLVYYCSEDHLNLHRRDDYCFPYRAGRLPEKGRVLFATRDIKPLDLILVDPGESTK